MPLMPSRRSTESELVIGIKRCSNSVRVHSECSVARASVSNSLMAAVDPIEMNELLVDREVDHLDQESPSIHRMFATNVEVRYHSLDRKSTRLNSSHVD